MLVTFPGPQFFHEHVLRAGLPAHEAAGTATHLLANTTLPAAVLLSAADAVGVGEAHCLVPAAVTDLFFDESAAEAWHRSWLDLADGACAALRMTLSVVGGGVLDAGHLLAEAATLSLP